MNKSQAFSAWILLMRLLFTIARAITYWTPNTFEKELDTIERHSNAFLRLSGFDETIMPEEIHVYEDTLQETPPEDEFPF